eukprot:scaffold658_cov148-Skeletonema_menzelii.AAC.8
MKQERGREEYLLISSQRCTPKYVSVTTNTQLRERTFFKSSSGRQTPSNVGDMSLWWHEPNATRFLFGNDPIQPLSFTPNRPQAAKIYLESLQGILLLANSSWPSSNPKPTRNSTDTPTSTPIHRMYPPAKSTSSDNSVLPAPKLYL